MMKRYIILCTLVMILPFLAGAQDRGRARAFGIEPGILMPGKWNAITDVDGVSVGHKTLINALPMESTLEIMSRYGLSKKNN